ncbi:MAG: peptidase M50 [Gammaproteobacteria bacterium RIFCSPHIGHO2_12_FULL_41_15]|nr:MAG: peptidase M50 [Gammaproteobacteria bacterium RIFCSPHIGHO2_12_FULL_41_15]
MEQVIRTLIVAALPLIFAITLHEAAHGLVAKWLGDKTAYMMGRVTANPIKHIDPIGTIIVPIATYTMAHFLIGWAKPVPVTWQNLKHPRRDMAIVALAGPMANFLMAILWALIMHVGLYIHAIGDHETWLQIGKFILNAGSYGILINMILMIFNLLPIPPLDGSRVLSAIIPRKWSYYLDRIEPYGMFIILAFLFLGLYQWVIYPLLIYMTNWIGTVFGLGPILPLH